VKVQSMLIDTSSSSIRYTGVHFGSGSRVQSLELSAFSLLLRISHEAHFGHT
jgi:hypothetical protein